MSPVYDFIGNSLDGVFAVDSRQKIVLWNDGASRILGYPPNEVLGRECYKILRGRDARGCDVCRRGCDAFRRAERLENPPTAELACRTRDGHEAWLSLSTVLVPSARQELSVLVHIFREVTQEHQLHEAAASLARVVAGASGEGAERGTRGEEVPDVKLTRRQLQILTLLVSGVSTEAIAERLSISVRTVRNHVNNILGKLDVHSRLEAVAYSIRNGIV